MGGNNFTIQTNPQSLIIHPLPSNATPDCSLFVASETIRTTTLPALSCSPGHRRSISLPALMSISFIGHPSFSSWTTGAGDRNRIERDSEARGGCGRHIVPLLHSFYLFAGAAKNGHVCRSYNILFSKCFTCFSGRCVIVWTVPVDLLMYYRSNIFYLPGR